MDINDLWTAGGGQVSWYERSPVEVRVFIDRLADLVVEKGREPNWAAVFRYFKHEFPDSAPKRVETITDQVRRLVEVRS